MILPRFTAVLPDGLGTQAPEQIYIEFPAATDVIIPGRMIHSNGVAFNLTGAYTLLLTFKEHEADAAPTIERQAEITNPTLGMFQFYVSQDDRIMLLAQQYICDVIFIDSTGLIQKRDEVTQPSRATITRTIGQPNDLITVPTNQPPLAQGPVGPPGPLSPTQHQELRQLIHFINTGPAKGFVTGAYRMILPAADPFPTSVTWWESAAMLKKLVEKLITRNPNQTPATIVWQMYDTDGVTVIESTTDTIAYSGVFETTRTRVIA